MFCFRTSFCSPQWLEWTGEGRSQLIFLQFQGQGVLVATLGFHRQGSGILFHLSASPEYSLLCALSKGSRVTGLCLIVSDH